jgi:hypothetical protein
VDTAENTLAESGTAPTTDRRSALLAAAVALLILIAVVAGWRCRRREARMAQRDRLHQMRAALEAQRPIVATATIASPAPGKPRHESIERQRMIGQLAGNDGGPEQRSSPSFHRRARARLDQPPRHT